MKREEYESQNVLLIPHNYICLIQFFYFKVLKRFDQNEIYLYVFKIRKKKKKTDSNSFLFGVSPLLTINYTHLQC